MDKLLIVNNLDQITAALEQVLQCEFEIRSCADGETGLSLLKSFRPDAMILNLTIPGKDGLTLLEEGAQWIPKTVLAITTYTSTYIERAAANLGVSYMILVPSRVEYIRSRLLDIFHGQLDCSPQDAVREHLNRLGIRKNLSGYRQLMLGIPMYSRNPNQTVTKELYPNIAIMCGNDSGRQIERSIRNAIQTAWDERDQQIWSGYFPGHTQCPTNKAFIAHISELL